MTYTIIDNRYLILTKLGSGAMGEVYKIRDTRDNRILALKVINKEDTSSEAVQRFKREFKLLAELQHPNLCAVYDFGLLNDNRSYFTMEYVEGKNIFDTAKDLSAKDQCSLIVQLCRALEYIHAKGLIHYDIKPGNVLVQIKNNDVDNAVVKLTDFGLAGEQQIKGGVVIKGTIPYIAPEVIKGLAVDHRADLYSLGVLLYQIFTQRPFHYDEKESFATLLKERIGYTKESIAKTISGMPKGIGHLILRLLAYEPADRFSRTNEIIKEINKITGSKFELETQQTLEGYLLSSRFVGRAKEMDLLKSFYEKSKQGEGRVIFVTGEAGIGKSRLLKEFRILAQLERSHCFVGYTNKNKTTPLEPFYNVFKELINYITDSRDIKLPLAVLFKIFPDLAHINLKKNLPALVPLAPEAERLRNFEALTELVKYVSRQLGEFVILLEDLHWADDFSLQFIEYLGRNIIRNNILICGSCRKEELVENRAFSQMIASLKNAMVLNEIELNPFGFESLYAFLDSTITTQANSSELTQYLLKRTGGNPFFAEEIMRTLIKEKRVSINKQIEIGELRRVLVPKRIEDVVLKRLEGLDDAAQRVMKYAAIILKDFNYGLMKRITNLDDTDLSRVLLDLKRRQIFVEESNRYRFYHATLREALYKRLGEKEKRDLNHGIGKVLELANRGRLEHIIEDLAYYFINAGDHEKGVKYGIQAAHKSRERYANEQAVEFYKGVLKFITKQDAQCRFDVLTELAKIEILVGDFDGAVGHYTKALRSRIADVFRKVKVTLVIANIYANKGDYLRALKIYKAGERLLRKQKKCGLKDVLRVEIDARICSVYLRRGQYRKALRYNFNNLGFLDHIKSEQEMLGHVYNNLGILESLKGKYGKANYDNAIRFLKKAYTCFENIGMKDGIVSALYNLGVCYFFKYDFQMACGCVLKSVRLSEKIGDYSQLASLLCGLANIYQIRGHILDARRHIEKAIIISEKIGNPLLLGLAHMSIGAGFTMSGDYMMAREHCEKSLKIFDLLKRVDYKVESMACIGITYQATADYSRSLKLYKDALKIARDMNYQYGIALLLVDIGTIFVELGENLKAKEYIDEARKIATGINKEDVIIECYAVLCEIHTRRGDYSVACDYYEKGVKMANKLCMERTIIDYVLLRSDIFYCERKYLAAFRIVKKSVKKAKTLGARKLYVSLLIAKMKSSTEGGILSRAEVVEIVEEAEKIAKEIGVPELLWKVYYEGGRFFHRDKKYRDALEYYKESIKVLADISIKIKNKRYKTSYLNRPDRKAVFAAVDEIAKIKKLD